MDISRWKTWDEHKKELLADPKVKAAYDALEPEFKLYSQLITLRQKKKLTQRGLAQKMGTHQSVIARIESGTGNLTVGTLRKIAKAAGAKLEIRFKI